MKAQHFLACSTGIESPLQRQEQEYLYHTPIWLIDWGRFCQSLHGQVLSHTSLSDLINLDYVDTGLVLSPAEVKTSILNIFPESPSESAFMLCTTFEENSHECPGKMLILVLKKPNSTFSLIALERLCRTRTGVSCCSVTCHHMNQQPSV